MGMVRKIVGHWLKAPMDALTFWTLAAVAIGAAFALLDWFAGKPMNWTGIIGAAILVAAVMWAFDKITES